MVIIWSNRKWTVRNKRIIIRRQCLMFEGADNEFLIPAFDKFIIN